MPFSCCARVTVSLRACECAYFFWGGRGGVEVLRLVHMGCTCTSSRGYDMGMCVLGCLHTSATSRKKQSPMGSCLCSQLACSFRLCTVPSDTVVMSHCRSLAARLFLPVALSPLVGFCRRDSRRARESPGVARSPSRRQRPVR